LTPREVAVGGLHLAACHHSDEVAAAAAASAHVMPVDAGSDGGSGR
jgi:hypothetical protein